MYDASIHYSKISGHKSQVLKKLNLDSEQFVLATIHRAENTDFSQRITTIFTELDLLSREIKVVIPLHPRTKSKLNVKNFQNILFIGSVGYLDMIALEKNCEFIVTDSVGVQKKAYFFKKPCITQSNETEWIELVEKGVNMLVDINSNEAFSIQLRIVKKESLISMIIYLVMRHPQADFKKN